MPHPQYKAQNIPFYTVAPNWQSGVSLFTNYATRIKESLDRSEERQQARPRCLYGLRYQTLPLTGQETGYIRRVVELAQALPVGMPVWTEACRIEATAAIGATTISIDATPSTLFLVLSEYVLLWRDYKTWEVLSVEAIGDASLVLTDPTTMQWEAGDMAFPVLLGNLSRNAPKNITDEHGVHEVEFEEVFNGVTNQGVVESVVAALEHEFTSVCRDEFRCWFTMPVGRFYTVQIADTSEGPWRDHIFTTLTGDETTPNKKELWLNNDYLGAKWFRVVDTETGAIRRKPINPQESALIPPVITFTDLNDAVKVNNVTLRTLWNDDGENYAVSEVENALIQNDRQYIVPRDRYEHRQPEGLGNWDGIPQVMTIDGHPGATHKWTRNSDDPVADTPTPDLDGIAMNIAAYRDDFGYLVKVRSFLGGCRSPVTCVLIDRRIPGMSELTIQGQGNAGSGSCDRTRTIGGVDYESGNSCILNYGGMSAFKEIQRLNVSNVLEPSQDHIVIYDVDFLETEGTYLGWPTYDIFWSMFRYSGMLLDLGVTWQGLPYAFTFIDIGFTGGNSYREPTTYGATVCGTAFVSESAFTNSMDNAIVPVVPTDFSPGFLQLLKMDWVLTAQHDFKFYNDAEYQPPAPNEYPDPVATPNDGDDFETYPSGDADGLTLNGGTGWGGPWVINSIISPYGEDTFDDYALGDVTEGMNFGESWGGPWVINEGVFFELTSDDFQTYTAGPMDNHVTFDDGEKWAGAWYPASALIATETFQSYATGSFTSLGTTGNGWAGPWVGKPTPVASDDFQSYAAGAWAGGSGGSGWSGAWVVS